LSTTVGQVVVEFVPTGSVAARAPRTRGLRPRRL